MRGRLIVFEGIDGVGKTTLSRLVASALGAVWMTTPDVDDRVVRERVDRAWYEPEARQLYYAGSVVHASGTIRRHLEAGRDVVVDRYWLTTVAYSEIGGSTLDLAVVEHALVAADATVFVQLPESERLARLSRRGVSANDALSLRRSRELVAAYRRLGAHPLAGKTFAVEGSAEPAVVAALVVRQLAFIRPGGEAEQLPLFERLGTVR